MGLKSIPARAPERRGCMWLLNALAIALLSLPGARPTNMLPRPQPRALA
jgi:hypothetical protein